MGRLSSERVRTCKRCEAWGGAVQGKVCKGPGQHVVAMGVSSIERSRQRRKTYQRGVSEEEGGEEEGGMRRSSALQ
mgnify:CR=1 FL=1